MWRAGRLLWADRFVDMLSSSSVTNHNAASERWTGCNVEKQSGESESESDAVCAAACSVESDGTAFPRERQSLICHNIHRGGSSFLPFVSYIVLHDWKKKKGGLVMSCVCVSTWPALAECDKDDARKIPNVWDESAFGLRVSASPRVNCLSRSAVHGKRGALASACVVTQKWVSWRLCNSGITVCGTKHAVTDQRVCLLDTFSLH